MNRLLPLAALALAAPLAAQEAPATPNSVVAEASPEEWVAIDPEDVLIMELSPAADGSGRYVVIQLMPAPFSQPWVENIRKLARAHWWDGKSVYRVVDNWVAQWGGGEDDDAGFPPYSLPQGVESPVVSYESDGRDVFNQIELSDSEFLAGAIAGGLDPADLPDRSTDDGQNYLSDRYAPTNFFVKGWPIAGNPSRLWPVHCYGAVGVARDLAPDTGTGAELYAVIGHAPRQLDRNIAVVGRVIEGIEYLSTLPRGTGEAGVYESRAEDTPIVAVRLASEHPDGAEFAYEYLDTASDSFARYVQVRANRRDDFYQVPAGGVDICNVQVPLRPAAP